MIDMTSSLFLETISWTGAVTSSDEDIEVITSGTYYVQGIALNDVLVMTVFLYQMILIYLYRL